MRTALYYDLGMANKKRGKDIHAVILGRRGGKAWAAKATPEERSEAGRRAATARWAKAKRKAKP
jgi:hypothetical protein